MAFELRSKVVELLSAHPEKRFRARDIAEWIFETYPEEASQKMARSGRFENRGQFISQLVAEIGASRPQWQRQQPQLRTTEGVRPRLYFWSLQTEEQEIEVAERDG